MIPSDGLILQRSPMPESEFIIIIWPKNSSFPPTQTVEKKKNLGIKYVGYLWHITGRCGGGAHVPVGDDLILIPP